MKNTFLLITIYIFTNYCLNAYAQERDSLSSRKDTILLEEVHVSTGLQRIPKERATGSFDFIGEQEFNQQVSTDVMSRLEATASGYLFERMASGITRPLIRGMGTLFGPTAPLIILDSFPYEGDINDINPNDVADITVLKDAAAASIWGARAANGVIVIQTKKGRYGQPLHVTFNSNVTIGSKPDLFYARQIASADFIEVEKMLYANGYYQSRINSSTFPALTPVVELLRLRETADDAEAAAIDNRIEQMKKHDVRNDFNWYFYRESYNQQYALNLQGGGDKSAWSAMAGYDRNVGNLNQSYQRTSLRLQQQYRPIPALELRASLLFTQSNNRNGRPGYPGGFPGGEVYPYASFTDDTGAPQPLYLQYSQSFVRQVGEEGILLPWDLYPLRDYLNSSIRQEQQGLLVDAGAEYALPLGLKLSLQYQYTNQQDQMRNLKGADSYAARDLINSYTEITTDGGVIRHVPIGGILDIADNRVQAHQGRLQLSLDQSWGDHQLTGLLGGEMRQRRNGERQHRLYGYDPGTLSFSGVDFSTPYPHYINGGSSFIPTGLAIDDINTRFASLFANSAYTYAQKYTLSFSARRDASNLFGLNTNEQWNIFWSAGGAWHLSKERFYQSSWLPYLKLRATYGLSGNIDPAMVAVTTLQYMGTNPYINTPYAQFSNYYNPDLRWETNKMLNIGVDFRAFNNRISGSIEFYTKKGTDLFGQTPIDYTAGVGEFITKNTGSMRGKGWDIQLNSENLTGVFRWQSHLNLSRYSDKVTENDPPSSIASSFLNGLNGTSGNFGLAGKPVNAMYAYRWAGLDPNTGDPLGYLDGEISSDYNQLAAFSMTVDDLVYVGPSVPQVFGSLGNTFSYHRLSLQVNLLFKFGHFFRRQSVNYGSLYSAGAAAGHADFARRWQKPGDEQHTDVPSMVYPAISARDRFYIGSEALIDRGDHIRLQFIRLSYDFRKLQVFGQATNLGVLWKANNLGLDPEAVSKNSMPAPAQYALGIRAQFSK